MRGIFISPVVLRCSAVDELCLMRQRMITNHIKNMYKMVYMRVRALMSVNLFRNSLLHIDSDSVAWLIINPRTLCSPSCAFSPSPHGGGLLCRSGRGHCQCEGSTGDQGRSAAEHCRGVHQHLGASGRPLRPVLRRDLGEVLLSCKGT